MSTLITRERRLSTSKGQGLVQPHGGTLVDLMVCAERADELKRASRDWPSLDLNQRQLCDLELLLNGGFSPLRGFMTRADYEGTCQSMRLKDGTLWPMPVMLGATNEFISTLGSHHQIALRDPEGSMLAVLNIEDVWKPDREEEAEAVFGTAGMAHPGVAYLLRQVNPWYVGGRLEGVRLPSHYDFRSLRLTPAELRAEFSRFGWRKVIGFGADGVMHRPHFELTLKAAEETGANLLIHPSVGIVKPGDRTHFVRIRCYQKLLPRYPQGTVMLALLPLAARMAGPRETLWHAIIRKNYGCTHFIVGLDHVGPAEDVTGKPFDGSCRAQELVKSNERDLGLAMVPSKKLSYIEDEDRYALEDNVKPGARVLDISETQFQYRLSEGRGLPEWFTFPEIAKELKQSYPPRRQQGFTVFFTGLSGSGKSTLANILQTKLLERDERQVTLLDGDIVRKNLSSELGFSKEHRDINIRRIGFVASEITKNRGIAICAPIAPYDAVRQEVRSMIQAHGGFILVYLSTSLETCEARDRKGLYAKARKGLIQNFTGISDPYEPPKDAMMVIDTTDLSPDEAAHKIYSFLEREGYVKPRDTGIAQGEIRSRPARNSGCAL